MEKVLITGGAGFIGSAVAALLHRNGGDVRVFDNLETGLASNLPAGVELINGDLRDVEAVAAAFDDIEVVVHLAAKVSAPQSVVDPVSCWDVNVVGTRNVLEAARHEGCRRVVLASSAAVYGDHPRLPSDEDSPVAPASPYASSKWMNEVDAAYYTRYFGLETVCLRFFNVYGPRQRPESSYAGVIAVAARTLKARQPFTIYGTGEQTRDFVFVDDVADAVSEAMTRTHLNKHILNVGTGHSVPLTALIDLIAARLGVTPELKFAETRPGDVLHSRADIESLERELGFHTRVDLTTGLAATLDWMAESDRSRVDGLNVSRGQA